jgi:hypothetical protein
MLECVKVACVEAKPRVLDCGAKNEPAREAGYFQPAHPQRVVWRLVEAHRALRLASSEPSAVPPNRSPYR